MTREKAKRLVAQAGLALVLAAMAAAVSTYLAQNWCSTPGIHSIEWLQCATVKHRWIVALDLFQLLALGYMALLLRAVQISEAWPIVLQVLRGVA
jgi:hypothetical protein